MAPNERIGHAGGGRSKALLSLPEPHGTPSLEEHQDEEEHSAPHGGPRAGEAIVPFL